MVRPGISFGPEDLRRLGIMGSAVLVIIKSVLGVIFAAVACFSFYIVYLILATAT
jgi:hypothetical protein